jgi:MinD-like ATPase involved in chromosome partitioning or flagellar assembly
MVNSGAGRIISVGGGQGVGASAVAAHLAMALAQDGARVALVDADAEAPALHRRFGLPAPALGLEALLDQPTPDLAAAAVETGVPGLRLVAGGGATAPGPRPSDGGRKLGQALRTLDAEVVVVDAGAGTAPHILDRLDAADLRLVVMTPELGTALEAYALVSGLVLRQLRRTAALAGQLVSLDEALRLAGPAASGAQLLALLAEEDGGRAASLQAGLARLATSLVGNQLLAAHETGLVYAISRMAHDFHQVEVPVLGSLRDSPRVHAAGVDVHASLLAGEVSDGDAATLRTMARALRIAPLPRALGAASEQPGHAMAPGQPLPLPAALPVDVADYQRAYDRHLVDLPATLVHDGRVAPVRLKDVSDGGVLCELDQPPPVGIRITLVVPDRNRHHAIPCVVRHASPGRRRAGLQFQLDREGGRRVAEEIRLLGLDQLLDASASGRVG